MSTSASAPGYVQEPPAYGAAPSPPAHKTTHAGRYQSVPQDDEEAAAARAFVGSDEEDVGRPFGVGLPVAEQDATIRSAFIKKVYSILFLQLLLTTVVSAVLSTQNISAWVHTHQWAFIIPLIGSFVSMFVLFWKRHSHPLNLILLALFTTLEGLSIGVIVSYIDQTVVLQALIITLFTFAGLTFFTLYTDWDFGKLAPYLFGGLLLLVGVGFVQMLIPFSRSTDLVFAAGGCLIFSGYIVYDTWLITKRLSPDEWVLANISLYLDIINLFINILRILNGNRDD
ncbi:UPF0005-domain-containing protein [Tilletiaria anomala UBC 951]|uniref:UPF0005-domain-containing protein n=1 Tax=Tilletiaria anomala (strain ATCC 24038 / CBS 436.72 / UBC 951) TaxID=1037660 RepID=A0A066WBM5_TILAU|nr:UPF0005-domain-containing protein [Tilletiaria anomala UBC 951]KDN48489.1 UPF0005-domain-containing protein [Tilletiaria anomala UBC 951]